VSGGGPTETEIKLEIDNPEFITPRLFEAHFQVTKPRIFESNTLYDFSAQTLRDRRSILRLRQVGDKGVLTFKGQAQTGKHKTREELETALDNPAALSAILERIGLIPGFRYEKYRTEYRREKENGVVTLDETPIGCFLEVEGEPEWIDRTAHELGFEESDYIIISYGALYVQHCNERGVEPGMMVFGNSPKV
jgi:adenylate cyclase class 2